MSKNFWKLATIGLTGYVIGREHRMHMYTSPVRYNYYGQTYDRPRSFVSTFANALGRNIGKKIEKREASKRISDINERANYPEFYTKDDAHCVIDWLEEESSNYGKVSVLEYLRYIKANGGMLANDDFDKHAFDLMAHYTDANYGWTDPIGAAPILLRNGHWKIAFPPIQCFKKDYEAF